MTVATRKGALPVEQALAVLRAEDTRPLLVVRECTQCTGTEDALLSRVEDNERTFLMSRWFHCVKLPPSVTEPEHAFHNLFAGEDPAHLFVSRADGSLRHDLLRMRSVSELWTAMEELIAVEYRDDPRRALGNIGKALDRLDDLDARVVDAERRLESAVEADRASSKKVDKLRRELTDLRAERNELRAQIVRESKLTRREPEQLPDKSG